jgi:hypothetical protein
MRSGADIGGSDNRPCLLEAMKEAIEKLTFDGFALI